MPAKDSLKAATIAAHANGLINPSNGGVVPAIDPSTTFVRDRSYQLTSPDNIYSRDDNDVVRQAESILAKLEEAEQALLFPSGMAAIAAVFRTVPNHGTVLVQSNIYWGTTKWIRDFCERREITLVEVDCSNKDELQSATKTLSPSLIFIETPSNPWLKTTDIRFASDLAKKTNSLLVVDSTAATPILSKPLSKGADIVMHSATKAINGHSDVLAGALATNNINSKTWTDIKMDRHDAGSVMGPFEAWLLIRGMRTLPLRVERMSANAQKIAEYLESHAHVESVLYPGLPTNSGHSTAKTQMSGGYGSLLSFLVKGDKQNALKVVGKLNLFLRATSLGGVESLVEHRHTIESHTGIPENLLRLSVGIEDVDDLIADLEQALTS